MTIKTGRNDSWPCGSGPKYKHCHGVRIARCDRLVSTLSTPTPATRPAGIVAAPSSALSFETSSRGHRGSSRESNKPRCGGARHGGG
ncbi:MAG: SEC-C domain-containing protein, partial [Gammaproteobacteria bacterium]|nr:SEC-C domain-containing protein [Gammaproteobacteria bacterium]